MKVAIIGGEASTTLIEALIKAVEEKTGETVEFVNIHAKDIEEFTQILPENGNTYTFTMIPPIETPFYEKKKHCPKGHEKPYKFHK